MDIEFQSAQMEEILRPDRKEAFENFISDLTEKRSSAKSMFDMMKHKDPNSLALKLSSFLINGSCHYESRCINLICELLTDDDNLGIWGNLSVPTQETVKSIFLKLIMLEESESIVGEIRYTVTKLAASLLPDNNWPELLSLLRQCLTSSSSKRARESAFFIFSELAEDISETIVPCTKDLLSLSLDILNDDTDVRVRVMVLRTAIKSRWRIQSLNEREQFYNLLPAMMKTLTDALSNGEDASAQEVLVHFDMLGKDDPRFFRRDIVDVVNTMFEIAEGKNLEERTRHLAVEFVLTLTESRDKVPGMLKKLPRFTDTCFAVLLDLLLDIEDDPIWHSENNQLNIVSATVSNNFLLGQYGLLRFSIALGGKAVTPVAMEQLCAFLAVPEWEKRHAALVALLLISSGCSKVMIKYLDQVVNMALHSFEDPHPRVRWAAINSMLVLLDELEEFSPDLREQYHDQVVPALAVAMDDFQNPRVQIIAATLVEHFFISAMPETLAPYLDVMLEKIIGLIQNDNPLVQVAALGALDSVSSLAEEHLQEYYDFVMPYLKTVLVIASDKSDQILGSRALECISTVGLAVGKEKFRDDLKQVTEALMSLQELQFIELNTGASILQAWFRICQCIEKDFLPYVGTVMPFLVEYALIEPDILLDQFDDSIIKVKFRDKILWVKGKILLLRISLPCVHLGAYAEILEEDFYPWISKANSTLAVLLKLYTDYDVRESAATAMSKLLVSAKLAVDKGSALGGNEYFKELFDHIILALGDALYSEPDTVASAILLCELNKCLEFSGKILDEDQVRSIIDEIKHVIRESSRIKGELRDREKSEDFDAEEAELLGDERMHEENVFSNVGEILITLIKTFKTAFLPFFDELSTYLTPTTGEDKSAEERKTCIFIFDELVEQCGEAAIKYYNTYLPFLLDSINDESPDVRQAALYGLGLCAECDVYAFKPFIGEALSRINVVIMHCDALEPENLWAYENAVSTLGKICQFHQENIDSMQIFPAWLNCLPIKVDMDEAKVVQAQICSFAERSERELLGPNYLHFPKVISVFAKVLCDEEDIDTNENVKRVINLLRHFQQTVPLTAWASARSLLLPQQEMELEYILSPDNDTNISTDAMELLTL